MSPRLHNAAPGGFSEGMKQIEAFRIKGGWTGIIWMSFPAVKLDGSTTLSFAHQSQTPQADICKNTHHAQLYLARTVQKHKDASFKFTFKKSIFNLSFGCIKIYLH